MVAILTEHMIEHKYFDNTSVEIFDIIYSK